MSESDATDEIKSPALESLQGQTTELAGRATALAEYTKWHNREKLRNLLWSVFDIELEFSAVPELYVVTLSNGLTVKLFVYNPDMVRHVQPVFDDTVVYTFWRYCLAVLTISGDNSTLPSRRGWRLITSKEQIARLREEGKLVLSPSVDPQLNYPIFFQD